FDLPDLETSVADGIDHEALWLTPGEGRRVFLHNPGEDGSAGSAYHLMVRYFSRLGDPLTEPPAIRSRTWFRASVPSSGPRGQGRSGEEKKASWSFAMMGSPAPGTFSMGTSWARSSSLGTPGGRMQARWHWRRGSSSRGSTWGTAPSKER